MRGCCCDAQVLMLIPVLLVPQCISVMAETCSLLDAVTHLNLEVVSECTLHRHCF